MDWLPGERSPKPLARQKKTEPDRGRPTWTAGVGGEQDGVAVGVAVVGGVAGEDGEGVGAQRRRGPGEVLCAHRLAPAWWAAAGVVVARNSTGPTA